MTTKTIYMLVEGDGEVNAASLLLRRLLHEHFAVYDYVIGRPYNASGRGKLTNTADFQRLLEDFRKQPDCDGLLILLDAEKDDLACPPHLAYQLAATAKQLILPFPTTIVCAVCEYESWFLYNLDHIAPKYNLTTSSYDSDPEQECAAKGWLDRHMQGGRRYKETIDQTKMTSLIDIERTAQTSRSFRRLLHAVEELLLAIDNGETIVSPQPPITPP